MTTLHELSAGQIASGISAGDFSAREVAEACIARHDAIEPRCLAWECFDPGVLLDQAEAIDRRRGEGLPVRLFEGVPLGVKDIFNTADFPTQMGSPLWKGFTPGNDARTVFNARQLGAVVPGKTTTAEFAVHTLGNTLNPHAADRTPGTSSSGSAAAIAARMVPVALGTQTAGSIIRPASFCGIYGFKPSFGLLPRTGMLKTTDSLDTIGFFAAHRADLRRLLDGLRVRGSDYPVVQAKVDSPQRKEAGRPWRIAFLRTHTWQHAEDYAKAAIEAWIAHLGREPGFEVGSVDEPAILADSHEVHSVIYDKALAYYFKEEFKRHELISPIMYEIIEHGNQITHSDYVAALDRQADMARAMDGFMAGYDALVSLGTAGEAPLRSERERPDPSLMWTMTYLPTLGVPAFRSPGGLPHGLQFGARRYNDYLLLDLMDELAARGLVAEMSPA